MRSERARARLVAGLGSVLALFSVMVAVHAAQTVPTTGLAAHWPLDASTTTTIDVGGSVNNVATLVGSPPSVPALFSNGLQFASANSRKLTVADNAELAVAPTDSFAVGAWIKPSGTAIMRVMNKWNGTFGFQFDINAAANGTTNTAGMLRLRLKDGANVTHDLTAATVIVNNAWKHIAFVCDRSTTPKMARLYVGGKQVATKDISTLTGTLTNTAILEIGGQTGATGFFNGIIDEPLLYRRALTPAEVQQLAAVPQGLTATTGATAQVGKVTLNWTAVPGANSYKILRSNTSGSGYAQLATPGAAATSYDDPVGAGTYYYVIRAVFTSAGGYESENSNQATGTSLPPPVEATPGTGLQTNEDLAFTDFTIKFNVPAPAGGSLVVVSSSDPGEGVVSTTYSGATANASGNGFQILVPQGMSPTIPVRVTGVDDEYADGDQPYTVTVTASNMGVTIPPVQVTNNDTSTPGVTITKTSGLVTTEGGGQTSFLVSLNTKPFGNITMSLTSSDVNEGVPSVSSVTFTPTNYNTLQEVFLIGVDDSTLDFSVPYTIVTGTLVLSSTSDNLGYLGVNPPDVQATNLDDEVIPPAPGAWGGGGSCGLLGLEGGLAMVLVFLARRRRRA
jgi:hypothetical protein